MTSIFAPIGRWLVSAPGVIDDPDQFPLLPGQMLLQGKAPMWSTSVATSVSGRERRRSNWSYPRWRFKIKYEVIRARPTQPELERLFAFFCLHKGQRTAFSYYDPTDHTVENETIGTGNGVRRLFQLTRTMGPTGVQFTEPVRRVLSPTIRVNGTEVSGWEIDENGIVNLATAPASGAAVAWSGQFMHLCRFTEDDIDPEQMTRDLWNLSGLELITVKR